MDALHLVVRQAVEADSTDDSLIGTPGHCDSGNEFNGLLGLRISAIFVILVGSLAGTMFPIYASRHKGLGVPSWAFFVAKYFGSGVILATAFIHLLEPAHEALTDECLTGPITDYSWVEGIVLMTIFAMFFVELMTMRYGNFGNEHGHSHGHSHDETPQVAPALATETAIKQSETNLSDHSHHHVPGEDHLGHARDHVANSDIVANWEEQGGHGPESFAAQMAAIFILEFGVVFHSIFIGLTLAVSGDEFKTLYIVLVFHQTFEGLGLGSRLGSIPWPRSKRWTPYLLALGYGLSTPIAIAIGLGVRNSYPPGSQTTLIVNGIFDSISAGILIYTGLVELMAHEFMFSPQMTKAPIRVVLTAFGMMCLGAGLMALLGKWA